MEHDNRPIGLFDSGLGGLTVLRTLLTHLPQESFVYLGDTARLPYGSKSPQTITRYLIQNTRFLHSQNVKAIVVACNTASTVLLNRSPDLALPADVPVYNVIEPGARAALSATANKRIGVLATRATVQAQSYPRVLSALDIAVTVSSQASPLLVPLVEEGWEDDPLTNLIVYRYVHPLLTLGIDTLILGCTHYPALRGPIGRAAGSAVQLIDSAEAIFNIISSDVSNGKMKPSNHRQELKLLATDLSPAISDVASRLMRPHLIPKFELVDTI
jgi:glutamate racemase